MEVSAEQAQKHALDTISQDIDQKPVVGISSASTETYILAPQHQHQQQEWRQQGQGQGQRGRDQQPLWQQ